MSDIKNQQIIFVAPLGRNSNQVVETRKIILEAGISISLLDLQNYIKELLSLPEPEIENAKKSIYLDYNNIYSEDRLVYKEQTGFSLYSEKYIILTYNFNRQATKEELESFEKKNIISKTETVQKIKDSLAKNKAEEKKLKNLLKEMDK